jgi:hypothetical protein
MKPVQDHDDLQRLKERTDIDGLRKFVNEGLGHELDGRDRADIPGEQLEAAFHRLDKRVLERFGFGVWDALLLLNDDAPNSFDPSGFEEWRRVYDWAFGSLNEAKLSVSLQDDFPGRPELAMWCAPDQFLEVTRLLRGLPHPPTRGQFRLIVQAVAGDRIAEEQSIELRA